MGEGYWAMRRVSLRLVSTGHRQVAPASRAGLHLLQTPASLVLQILKHILGVDELPLYAHSQGGIRAPGYGLGL